MKTIVRVEGFIFAVSGGIIAGIALTSPNMPLWWWVLSMLLIITGGTAFVIVDDSEQ